MRKIAVWHLTGTIIACGVSVISVLVTVVHWQKLTLQEIVLFLVMGFLFSIIGYLKYLAAKGRVNLYTLD